MSLFLAFSASASAASLSVWTHYTHADLKWLQDQARFFERSTGQKIVISKHDFGFMGQEWVKAARQGKGPDVVVGYAGDYLGQVVPAGLVLPVGKNPIQSAWKKRR